MQKTMVHLKEKSGRYYYVTDNDHRLLAQYGRKLRGEYWLPALEKCATALQELGEELPELPHHNREINIPNFYRLYEFQKQEVRNFVNTNMPGLLLAVSPGLGKSAMALISAEITTVRPVLIVCPASLMYMWREEIKKWCGDGCVPPCHPPVRIWHPKYKAEYTETPLEGLSTGYVITTYDMLVRNIGKFAPIQWPLIIIDESLMLQNRKTKRFDAFKKLRFDKMLCLSGNPTAKYYDDLWTQLHLIWPEAFGSYWRFAQDYCHVEDLPWGKVVTGNRARTNPADSYPELIRQVEQKKVLPELPDIVFQEIPLELTPRQRKLHDELIDAWDKDDEKALAACEVPLNNRLALSVRLQQIVSGLANLTQFNLGDDSAKAEALVDLFSAHEIEFPAIIWFNWVPGARHTFNALDQMFSNGTNNLRMGFASGDDKRDIEAYKKDELDVLFLSLAVGKWGHTLTNTRHMIYLDRSFDADAYFQSLRRVKRIGLQHVPIATILRCPNSYEEYVEKNLAGKMPGIAAMTDTDLKELLRGLKWNKASKLSSLH